MFSLKPIFLGLIFACLPIFCSLSTGNGSCRKENLIGLNRPCSKNVRISILTKKFFLGVSPFYDAESNSIYFTGGVNSTVYKYCIDSKKLDFEKLGDEYVVFIVPIKGVPDHYLISYGDKLALMEWSQGKASYRIISQPDPAHPWRKYIVNHALVSSNGAFFFFTEPNLESYNFSISDIPSRQCTLFNLLNGKQKTQIRDLSYGSGPAFNPSGNELYFSDGYFNESYIATYNERRNSIENVEVFVEYPHLCLRGRPSGLAFDTEGFLWMATFDGNRLLKLDPHSGTIVCSIELPISPYNFIFGKCPGARDNKLGCIYCTTSNAINPGSEYSGRLLLIEGLQSTGYLQNKVPWSTIFGNRGNDSRGNDPGLFDWIFKFFN